MKNIIILIFLIVSKISFGQNYPVQSNIGGPTTLVKAPNYGGVQAGLIPFSFTDTTAASAALTYGKNYNGFLIWTTTPPAIWYRAYTLNKWVQLIPGADTTSLSAWSTRLNTNIPTDVSLNGYFGTTAANGIGFYTSNTQRLILPASGLTLKSVVGDTTLNKPMVWNTSTKEWNYSYWFGGSGSTPTWQETLTAGSTLTTDNAVTSDQDFIWTSDQILGDGEWSIIGSASKLLKADLSGISSQLGVTSGYSVTMSTANQSDNHVGSFFEVFVDSIGMGPYLGVFAIDTLNNYSAQNTLIGWVSTSGADRGRVGYVTLSGLTLSGGVLTNPNPTPGANTALSNLASVAVNTSIIPGTTNSIALGTTAKIWSDVQSDYFHTGALNGIYSGYSGAQLGGVSTHAVLDFVDNNSRVGEFYTDASNFNFFTDAGIGIVFYVNNSFGAPAMQFSSAGALRLGYLGAGALTADASGNITSVSDLRLKNIQGQYEVGLNQVMKINPIVYKWKPETKLDSVNNYIGFAAQNIEAALGENAIGVNHDGYKSIQDRAILAAMVNSIKQLKDLNDEQQIEIDNLKKEVKKLKKN